MYLYLLWIHISSLCKTGALFPCHKIKLIDGIDKDFLRERTLSRLALVSIAVRYEYFIKVSPLSMTRVHALVSILDYADTPLKKPQNTKDSRLFVGPDVLGFFFMMYDDLSLSQNIERINL